MLWLAEKCVELGASSWRPVVWRHSRDVSPKGEGDAFARKVRARITGALGQSGGAWLPEMHRERDLADVTHTLPTGGTRLLLDAGAPSILGEMNHAPCTIAIGPEGGFTDDEREFVLREGFRGVSVAANILRFETAAIVGLSIVRAQLAHSTEAARG
jgi:16S rRNA (uracil1498-N3)-methyltransferase